MKPLLFTLPLLILFVLGCEKKNPEKEYQYAFIDVNLTVENDIKELEVLKNNFRNYWEASSIGDLNASYALELPYLNFLKSLEWYRDFKADDKRHYTATMLRISSENNDSEVAFVRANYTSDVMDINLTDKWIYVNGEWYHYYSQSLLPPPPKPIK